MWPGGSPQFVTISACSRSRTISKNPASNGYRSLHLIVEVPVFLKRPSDDAVEVASRTIAMDFWQSLEHQLSYKKDVPHSEIGAELKHVRR